MSRLRGRLAFGWRVVRCIPRDPELIPMLAKLAATRVALIVGCWWTGIKFDDLRRELQRRKRLQLLIGGDASPPV
jgi:hypothetical protein